MLRSFPISGFLLDLRNWATRVYGDRTISFLF
ncbi:hypothetical protein OIU76_024312 [Salix suchowensis]|nr:hypothetical protein OIU76_024312 [Salix suchowensis]